MVIWQDICGKIVSLMKVLGFHPASLFEANNAQFHNILSNVQRSKPHLEHITENVVEKENHNKILHVQEHFTDKCTKHLPHITI